MEIFKRQDIGEISMADETGAGVAASILSDITVFMKYAKYNESLGRRETWEEIVTRNKEMHQRKYPRSFENAPEDFGRLKRLTPPFWCIF